MQADEKRALNNLIILHALYRYTSRGTAFFFILSLILLCLYLIGNFQEFLDSSQIFLLRILDVVLLAEVFSGLVYIGVIFYIRHQRRYLAQLIFSALSVLLCFVFLLVLKFLTAWFQF
jgi:hypothetical protein